MSLRYSSKLLFALLVSNFVFCFEASADLAEDGISLFKIGRYKEAAVALEEACQKRKDQPDVLYYYALSLQKTGQASKSYAVFHRIVTIAPSSQAAVYARQAMGLPPARGAQSAKAPAVKSTTASAPKGSPLPFDCPVTMYPGSRISEATDVPAKLYGFKSIKLHASTTPQKVINYYEAELANNSDWKLREKLLGVESDKPNPEGNKMCGEITFLNQKNSGWAKQMSITVAAPQVKPEKDIATVIEITLYDRSHFQ
ncbi:MAG: hypothetical protein SFY67_08445 [Candidatus Melainabacteria bacterium]|nr:hypothetical protein [Candidatus Melainabacteria bacterium]